MNQCFLRGLTAPYESGSLATSRGNGKYRGDFQLSADRSQAAFCGEISRLRFTGSTKM